MTHIPKGANAPVPTALLRVAVGRRVAPGTPVIDASALLLDARGMVRGDADLVFYNQPRHPSGAVRHLGRAEGGGQLAEWLELELPTVEAAVQRVLIAASCDDGGGGVFGAVPGLYVQALGPDGSVAVHYAVTDATTETAFVLGEFYRRDGTWKFRAVGQGYDSGLAGLATDFGIVVAGAAPAAPAPAPYTPPAPDPYAPPAPAPYAPPAPGAPAPYPPPAAGPYAPAAPPGPGTVPPASHAPPAAPAAPPAFAAPGPGHYPPAAPGPFQGPPPGPPQSPPQSPPGGFPYAPPGGQGPAPAAYPQQPAPGFPPPAAAYPQGPPPAYGQQPGQQAGQQPPLPHPGYQPQSPQAGDPLAAAFAGLPAFHSLLHRGRDMETVTFEGRVPPGPVIVEARQPCDSPLWIDKLNSRHEQEHELISAPVNFFHGRTACYVPEGEPLRMRVNGDEEWTVAVHPLNAARPLGTAALSGPADDVLIHTGPAGRLEVTLERGPEDVHPSMYLIAVHDFRRPDPEFFGFHHGFQRTDDLLTGAVGPFRQTIPLPAGPVLLLIEANSAWTLQVRP
ncbi:TerD family protein [Streptomyces sp. NPDC055078]